MLFANPSYKKSMYQALLPMTVNRILRQIKLMALIVKREESMGAVYVMFAFFSLYCNIGINKYILLTYYPDYTLKWGKMGW